MAGPQLPQVIVKGVNWKWWEGLSPSDWSKLAKNPTKPEGHLEAIRWLFYKGLVDKKLTKVSKGWWTEELTTLRKEFKK